MATELTRCPHGRWISDKLHCRECMGLGPPALYALMLDVQAGAVESDRRFDDVHDGVLCVGAPRQRGRPEGPQRNNGWLVKP